MAEDTSSWQSAARAAEECQYLNQLYDKEDLKVIFLTEWGKKMDGNLCHWGGGGGPTPNGKCHFKFPVFWNIPLCCHITDNVLNVYSLGLILLIIAQSTSSCFKAPARASKHQLVLIWKGFIDWNRPDYLANSLDGFPQKMPSLRLPASR